MNKTTALIASLLMIATSLSGCITEELVDDVLGCMDENAENYDENATLEALGDCFYMASVDQFMGQISEMSIDEMLDVNPRAGYSSVIEMTMVEDEMGMGEMNIHIEEHVMVDLANDSAMVRTYLSVYPMMTVDYTVIQVGQVVNIHSLASGMMADAVSSSTQTRDADGSVLDMVHAMIDGSPAEGIPGLGMGDDQPDSDDDDDMPTESASFTYDASTGTQTMTMSMTEDGASTEMTIHLDENEELVSYEMNMDDGTNTTVMSYTVMWGDAVVIEVDETLPKTALPVWFDGLSETPDDGHGDDDGDDGDDGDGPPSPEEVLYMFDSDGDGYLSWDEFWYSWGDGESQDAQDDMMGIFQEADTDSDDLLSLEELDYFIEMVDDYDSHDGDEMSPDMILDMMDYNDDGSVSWTEFDDFIIYEDGGWADEQERSESQDAFDYSDANGDGSLDYEELEHWISTMGDDDDSEEMFLCDDGHEEIPMDWVNDGEEDCEDGSDEYDDGEDVHDDDGDHHETEEDEGHHHHGDGDYHHDHVDGSDGHTHDDADRHHDHDGDDHDDHGDDGHDDDGDDDYAFYCSNDGEDYAESMGGILCPEGPGVTPECPNGESCVCIDVDGSCDDGDDDWGYYADDDDGSDSDNEPDMWMCDNGEEIPEDWVNDGEEDCEDGSDEYDDGDSDNDGHEAGPRSGVVADNLTFTAPLSDFELRFLNCNGVDSLDECSLVASGLLESGVASAPGEANCVEGCDIMFTFIDSDMDGMVSPGDTLEIGDDYGFTVAIYDTWAEGYTEDSQAFGPNVPGFGALLGAIALIGASMASRRD